jgi:hypothetical protein
VKDLYKDVIYLKCSCVYQEEKEHTKAFREMEEKLMATAFYKLVSWCFLLYFNDTFNNTLSHIVDNGRKLVDFD